MGREARGKGRAEGLGWAAFHNWHRWDALIGKLYAIIDCRLTTVDGFRWKSYKLFEYSSIRNEPKVRSSFPLLTLRRSDVAEVSAIRTDGRTASISI